MLKLKRIGIIIAIVIGVIVISLGAFYINGMSAVGKSEEKVVFEVTPGTSKLQIVSNLKKAGLIKNELVLKGYLFFHNDLTIQAGTYELSKDQTPAEMLKKMSKGDIKIDTVSVTLIEGKRLTSYLKTISAATNISEKEFLEITSNETFLKECIEKYWFLTEEILNNVLYYPLEGYLYPDTYEFLDTATASEIIIKILDNTYNKLNGIKELIEASNYSVHEILSIAAIIELEAVKENDRKDVSQVIYKRLSLGMSLGMDVTSYYGVRKNMGEDLYVSDLENNNPYNTSSRNTSMNGKLPVGPICNSSLMSIKASLEPSEGDYLYFFADIKTGQVYFTKTYDEHMKIIKEVG